MFERFTDGARRVVVYAQEESRLLRHQNIGTEHLLLGMFHDDTTTGAALGDVGLTLDGARDRIAHALGRGRKEASGHIPFTPKARQVLEQSLRHALHLGQEHVAPPHLLRALLDDRDSDAVRTLVALGVDLDALTGRADELASSSQPDLKHEDHNDNVGRVLRQRGSLPVPGKRTRKLHYRRGPEAGDEPDPPDPA